MSSRTEIEERLSSDLAMASKEVMGAAKCILDFVVTSDTSQTRHLTYSMLLRICHTQHSHLLEAIQYLCGDVSVLERNFEFIDGDVIEQLDPAYVAEVWRDRRVVHPHTGEYVDDGLKKIFVYFSSGSLVRGLHK